MTQLSNLVLVGQDLDFLALGYAALGPVATPTWEGHLGVWHRFDQIRFVDDVELLIVTRLTHIEPLIGVLRLRIELDLAARSVELDIALERFTYLIDANVAGLFDGHLPEIDAHVSGFDGVVRDAILAVLVLEFLDEFLVLGSINALEIVPGREMALDLGRIQAAKLVLADADGDNGNVVGGDAGGG